MTKRYSQDAIAHAYNSIDPIFLNTPQFELEALNQVLGTRILLKIETLNPIRSFKGRGTDYFVQQQLHQSPFVCASAGNFGQGMAYACRKYNLPLTVFAAETANPLKLERIQQFGAEVRLVGLDFDAAKSAAKAYAQSQNYTYVEDGHEPDIAIGAGTIALELSHSPDPIDILLIPIGNGALINGIGSWYKAKHPATQVIGVVATGAPAMELSWRNHRLMTTETVQTIADGIAVRIPVPEALDVMKDTVDDIVQVSDQAILESMKLLHRLAGIIVEPAGAIGVAAAMVDPERFSQHRLATPLCGSNLTEEQINQWL
ncbi:MAG: threonine/serine dehydratase [Oculatellaceae cyanobacterium Prado106]|jgi:threonine dehydratase|nr:threonine/serine dehydratase [Oculatellaceae cyanobacterium Prado106]